MRRLSSDFANALSMVALAAAGWLPAIAGAQVTHETWPPISSLRSGDTVRVWASRPPLAGTAALITRLEGDTLALANVPGRRVFREGVTVPVPLQALTRLEVQRGHRRSVGWGVAGAAIGLAAGTLMGGYAGVALECGSSCSDQGDLGGLVGLVLGGGVGGLAGAITGGIVGARRRPRWQPVALPTR